jgi:hypothetical protein
VPRCSLRQCRRCCVRLKLCNCKSIRGARACCQATLFVRGIASNFVRLSGRAAIPPASFALLPQRGREQGSSFSKAPLPPLHLCLLSLLLFIPLNTVTHTSRYFSPPLYHPISLQLGLHCIENPDVCATTCTKLVPCFFGGSAPDSLPFQYKACPTSPP